MLRRGWSPWVHPWGLCHWSCCCSWSPAVPQSCRPGSVLTCRGYRSPRGGPMGLQTSGAGRPKGPARAAGVLLCAPSLSLLCWHSSPIPIDRLLSPFPLVQGLPRLAWVAVPSQPCLGPKPQRPLSHLHINGLWGLHQGEQTLIRPIHREAARAFVGAFVALPDAGPRAGAGAPAGAGRGGWLLTHGFFASWGPRLPCTAGSWGQAGLSEAFCPRLWVVSPREVADSMGFHRLLPT